MFLNHSPWGRLYGLTHGMPQQPGPSQLAGLAQGMGYGQHNTGGNQPAMQMQAPPIATDPAVPMQSPPVATRIQQPWGMQGYQSSPMQYHQMMR